MDEVNEWNCSGWVISNDLYIPIGRFLYPLHIDRVIECVREAAEAIADAFRKVMECVGRFLNDTLPNICNALADAAQEQYETPPRRRWKPVRVLGCSPNTTTPRQRIHRIQRRG